MAAPSEAERFYQLFLGLSRAHGRFIPKESPTATVKQEGKTETIHEEVTVQHWEDHVEGSIGVGIVPIRDDATCRWGAIDIDGTVDHVELEREVTRLELPLIVCRSKSGGAHLFAFFSEDVSAELARAKLMEWAIDVGHSGVEVFPKQTRLASERDVGNWINMPYFGGDRTTRFAIVNGIQLNTEQFLNLAERMRISAEVLRSTSGIKDAKLADLLAEAPPCLQILAKQQFGEGQRNNALYNLAIYAKKRHGDDFQRELDVLNQQYLDPPLGSSEVDQIARRVAKKDYQYKCHEPPINAACNRQICLTRKYGVGGQSDDPGVVFGTLIKVETDPVTWIWDVDGARIELTTAELKDQNRFHSKCIEVINKWPLPLRPKIWSELIRQKLNSCEVQHVPIDATPRGQLGEYLEQFCLEGTQARDKQELLQGRPWTDKGRTYFRAVEFRQFLLRRAHMRVEPRDLWNWLRSTAQHHNFHIKGRYVNCWSVPAFAAQDEDFDVPELEEM